MRKPCSVMGVIIVMLATLSPALGQKATERFIPLGQSPGLSMRATHIGAISAIDAQKRTISVAAPAGAQTATVNERTTIWLDRTRLKAAAAVGSFADLRVGQRIEIKLADPAGQRFAEWIKVEVGEGEAAPRPSPR